MQQVYSRNPGFVQREVAGECLLVPIHRNLADANSIYVLNETAASLWRRLDGKLSLAEIADQLLEEYAVEREQLQKDLTVLIDDLLGIKAIAAA
jgi:hypothetical protein